MSRPPEPPTLTHVHATPPPLSPPPSSEPRAVEITAVLDDTVLSVHHLADPRGGRIRRATWVLAAASLVGFGLFASQAYAALSTARANRDDLRRWLEHGAAPIDFRARRLHPLADVGAALGLIAGFGLGGYAYLRAVRERRRPDFRIGRAHGVDLPCDSVEDHVLVAPSSRGLDYVFTPAPGMTAELTVDGKPRPLDDAPLTRGARIRANLGSLTLLISSVAPPRGADLITARLDRRAIGYAAASTAAHALLVLLFFLLPADASGYASDDFYAARRAIAISFKPLEDPKLLHERGDGDGGAGSEKPSPAETGKSGALGDREAVATEGKGKIKKVTETPSLGPPPDERSRSAGILGVIHARRDALGALTAMSDLTSGLDDEDIRGGYRGDTFADSRGWGTGPDGDGPGGGGPQPGTIGSGPWRGPPVSVLRMPPPGLPGRKPRTTFKIGPPEVPEGIDKNMIRRYVRQKHAQISYCYERELTVSPSLTGTANTAFTIDQNGRVIEARASGLGSSPVERCLEEVLRSIQFPRGEIIHVTSYPFTFHPAGG